MAQLAYLQQQQLYYKQHAIDSSPESTDMLTGLRMYSDAFSMFDEVMGDQQKILYTYPTVDESEAIMQLTAAGRQLPDTLLPLALRVYVFWANCVQALRGQAAALEFATQACAFAQQLLHVPNVEVAGSLAGLATYFQKAGDGARAAWYVEVVADSCARLGIVDSSAIGAQVLLTQTLVTPLATASQALQRIYKLLAHGVPQPWSWRLPLSCVLCELRIWRETAQCDLVRLQSWLHALSLGLRDYNCPTTVTGCILHGLSAAVAYAADDIAVAQAHADETVRLAELLRNGPDRHWCLGPVCGGVSWAAYVHGKQRVLPQLRLCTEFLAMAGTRLGIVALQAKALQARIDALEQAAAAALPAVRPPSRVPPTMPAIPRATPPPQARDRASLSGDIPVSAGDPEFKARLAAGALLALGHRS